MPLLPLQQPLHTELALIDDDIRAQALQLHGRRQVIGNDRTIDQQCLLHMLERLANAVLAAAAGIGGVAEYARQGRRADGLPLPGFSMVGYETEALQAQVLVVGRVASDLRQPALEQQFLALIEGDRLVRQAPAGQTDMRRPHVEITCLPQLEP